MTVNIAWRLAVAAIGGAMAGGAAAADSDNQNQGAGVGAFLSRDSDGFSTQRLAVEYLPKFTNGNALTGGRYTEFRFEQANWSRRGQQITLMHRSIEPVTTNGWQLEAGLSRQGGHDLLSLDGAYRAALAERSGLELFINRDWVETRNALDRGIHVTFACAALEQGFGPHLTVVGLGGYQHFSDGNHRNHGRIKLIVQPNLDLGLTLQARYRRYNSARDDVGGAYFNPARYDEAMLAVGWRKKLQGWMTSMTAGVGQQRVADAPRTPARLLELVVQAPSNPGYGFLMRGGMNRGASFNGPNYSYVYVQAEWILGF